MWPQRGTNYQMMTDRDCRLFTVRDQQLNFVNYTPNETKQIFDCLCVRLTKEPERHRLNLTQIHSQTHNLTQSPLQSLSQTGVAQTWFLMLRPPFKATFTSLKIGKTSYLEFPVLILLTALQRQVYNLVIQMQIFVRKCQFSGNKSFVSFFQAFLEEKQVLGQYQYEENRVCLARNHQSWCCLWISERQ